MKEKQLKHPRKVVWAMRDFLNEISELTYEVETYPSIKNETEEEWFNRFLEGGTIEKRKATCKLVETCRSFSANMNSIGCEYFVIGYNINSLFSTGVKQFRQDITSRCTITKGFADITLALLHELGHLSCDNDFGDYDRFKAMNELEKYPLNEINFHYFKLPDETAATNWAIEWLQNPEHRKIAKRFEKKFFACFE